MITWLKVIDYFKKCPKWQSNRIHDSFVIVIVPALVVLSSNAHTLLAAALLTVRPRPCPQLEGLFLHFTQTQSRETIVLKANKNTDGSDRQTLIVHVERQCCQEGEHPTIPQSAHPSVTC